jgi:hypothetical protein
VARSVAVPTVASANGFADHGNMRYSICVSMGLILCGTPNGFIRLNDKASGRRGESRRFMDHVCGHAAGANGPISTIRAEGAV